MKIVLATPIYPPDIGGPATYSKKLKEGLEKAGILAEVVSYRDIIKITQPLRIIIYTAKLFLASKNGHAIYAFNLISCGLPAYFSSMVLRKRFIVRIGGDFLWERAVEKGRTRETLREYYENPKKPLSERFWMGIVKKVLKNADVIIFTSEFQKQIYLKHYGIENVKTVVVPNPFPEVKQAVFQASSGICQILYAGRFLKLKNLEFLIKVFYRILEKTDKKVVLKMAGEGPERENLQKYDKVKFLPPLERADLMNEINRSYLCVLPSITEITPNFVLECVALGKPVLLTKETGLDGLKDVLILIDPKNEADLERKILSLLDGENYAEYAERIKSISKSYTWDNLIERTIEILEK